MTKRMPAHAIDFTASALSATAGIIFKYSGRNELALLALGIALATSAHGFYDLNRENRLRKLPLVKYLFPSAPASKPTAPTAHFAHGMSSGSL